MKKIIITLMSLLVILTMTTIVSAENIYKIEGIESASDKDGIYILKNDIVDAVNSAIYSENRERHYSNQTHKGIIAENIDFAKMYKEYENADEIFMQNLTGKAAIDALNNLNYSWIMQFHFEDITVDVVVQRGRPVNKERVYATDDNGERVLSDEQISILEARVGKWYVSSYGIGYLNTRYEDAIRNAQKIESIDNTVHFISTSIGICAFIATDDGNYINCFDDRLLNEYNTKDSDYIEQSKIVNLYNDYKLGFYSGIEDGNMRAGGVLPADIKNDKSISIDYAPMLIVLSALVLGVMLTIIYVRKGKKSNS